jgi:hypothetical protein
MNMQGSMQMNAMQTNSLPQRGSMDPQDGRAKFATGQGWGASEQALDRR